MPRKSRWQVILRYLFRSKRNPESLARGVGLGLFIGFLPAIGFQIVLALLAAGAFNANRTVTVLGTFITNPLTAIPVSAFSLWLGDWILPGTRLANFTLDSLDWSRLVDVSSDLGLTYLLGCLVLSIAFGISGYFFVRLYFYFKQQKV